MTQRDDYCADLSRAASEPCIATPPNGRGWLLVSHRGRWSDTAASTHPAAEAVALQLGLTLVLVRADSVPDGLALLVTGSSFRWTAGIDNLDHVVAAPVEGPIVAVCTHARHDLCCGRYGARLRAALASRLEGVIECTHVGGDRFAPNAILAPPGVLLGRLDRVSVDELTSMLVTGHIQPDLVRGRPGQSRASAAAEAAVRAHTGRWDLLDLVTVDSAAAPVGTRPGHFVARQGRTTLDGLITEGPSYRGNFTCRALEESVRVPLLGQVTGSS